MESKKDLIFKIIRLGDNIPVGTNEIKNLLAVDKE